MPEISRFFGMSVYMYYDDHEPPHIHVRHQGNRAKVDFDGNFLLGRFDSPARVRLLRDWLSQHRQELEANWQRAGHNKPLEKIPPLK